MDTAIAASLRVGGLMFETATHRFIQGANGVAIHTVVMGEDEPLSPASWASRNISYVA